MKRIDLVALQEIQLMHAMVPHAGSGVLRKPNPFQTSFEGFGLLIMGFKCGGNCLADFATKSKVSYLARLAS